KKIFSILFASVIAFMAVSCYPDDLTVFDTSKATAPVLGSYEIGPKAVTATFTPGNFNQDFNKNVAPNHFFVIREVNGKSVSKPVTTANKDGVLSASVTGINNALISLGFTEGDVVNARIFIRASMQTNAGDNGRNGYVDSQGSIDLSNFEIVFPQGSPYQEYTSASNWSVIGSIAAYEMSWDKDLEMWSTEDGMRHVAKCVTLTAGDEFKFRQDQAWGVNMGGDFGSLGSEFSVSQDGPNIVVGASGLYDLWLDLSTGTATVTEAYQAYPDHKEASNWSVIGSLSELGISWDGDIPMLTDGNSHVAQGVTLAAGDEFKFRQDKDWAVNLGGDFGALGTDFAVSQDGPNIKVGADGIYDLIVNPGAGTAQVVETLGGGVSGIIGGDEPEPGPEPEPVTGWNIIGLNGDWENDILATADGNVYTAYITVSEATEFKWRLDGAWDSDFGGTFVTVGEPFTAEPGGSNIKIGAGFWKVVLDTDALTITISEGSVWSLIGDFNGWSGDVDMVNVDGKWISPAAHLNANGFKIRYNHDWALSLGGSFEEFGKPFEAISADGPNIMLPAEGDYVVTYDPEAGTITVDKFISGWNVIGLNGNWNDDVLATENNGVWTVRVTAESDTEFKWRKDADWAENYGGDLVNLGEPFAAVPGGNNIKLPAGYWLLTLDLSGAEPMLMVSDGTVWSLIGVNGDWNTDIDMTLVDGLWVSPETAISGEFKIRQNHGWDVNRGGVMTAVGEAFDAVADGDNIKVEDGTYIVTYDPGTEKITVNNAKKTWGVIGDFNSWGGDVVMSEVAPGIWVSDAITVESGGWKVRFDGGWDVNRGGATPEAVGQFVGAYPGGDNINMTGTFKVVYNANNETIGTLGWGVVGTITGWAGDIPMNLGANGVWYSVPVTLGKDDEIKIRYQSDWGVNRGGACTVAESAFDVTPDGSNFKAPEEGTYMVVYYPKDEQITLTKEFWGMIGDFNSWGGDVFMLYDGAGHWNAYNQSVSGAWKLRRGADWAVNRGGTFVETGKAFEVTQDGPNITVTAELASFSVDYHAVGETVTVK
ncbi:MAG: hypothetical protein IJ636_04680, partial [Bacteroidales bacterium]|nr:hypothetical protein [Bacteroidales bacterium]